LTCEASRTGLRVDGCYAELLRFIAVAVRKGIVESMVYGMALTRPLRGAKVAKSSTYRSQTWSGYGPCTTVLAPAERQLTLRFRTQSLQRWSR